MNIFLKKRGSLSVDFLFSFSVFFLLVLFFILVTVTIVLAEVAQYISFATAREYMIAHTNYGEHTSQAHIKYDALKGQFFKPGHSGLANWFELSGLTVVERYPNPTINLTSLSGQYEPELFFGVLFEFTSKVMTMDIPFLGSVNTTDSPSSDGFAFPISSFLGREPNQEECFEFKKQRGSLINSVTGGVPASDWNKAGNKC